MKNIVKRFTLVASIMIILLSTSCLAAPCGVKGCYRRTVYGGSCYYSTHKCRQSGCTNKADSGGYYSRHHYKKSDPYDVYDYEDAEDFYFDWEDDFEDFEDPEDYWYDAWD